MSDELLHFVETTVFTKQIDKLASIDILTALQDDLAANRARGDIISGTNGARKARIGDKSKSRGKSGSYRYIYVYFEHVRTIYLLLFYAKNVQATLSSEEKKVIAGFVASAKKNLGEE